MTDFYRNVYCVMGLPVDALSMDAAVEVLQQARLTRKRCFFSTPNLNFLVASQNNAEFRKSVCRSDMSLADGMPLVWLAKLLGIPITQRVSGSDLFEQLRLQTACLWRVFFFGGQRGVGQDASLAIGEQKTGVQSSGYIYPGFVGVPEMSRDDILATINQSNSDMVLVSLGAAKGQAWICNNLHAIQAPVVSHLGAVINFVAGSVQRAPRWMQRVGLEWLWRIKEESSLLQRYVKDGGAFLWLLVSRAIPLAWHQKTHVAPAWEVSRAVVVRVYGPKSTTLVLSGAWQHDNLQQVRDGFSAVLGDQGPVTLDMADVTHIDAAFVGLLLLLEQALQDENRALVLENMATSLQRYLRLSGVYHLVMA